jgi:hypothetical protein
MAYLNGGAPVWRGGADTPIRARQDLWKGSSRADQSIETGEDEMKKAAECPIYDEIGVVK